MKAKYLIPEVQIIEFEAEDVITTSCGSIGLGYGGDLEEGGGPSIDVGDLFG